MEAKDITSKLKNILHPNMSMTQSRQGPVGEEGAIARKDDPAAM
jgi:hypothetical protein